MIYEQSGLPLQGIQTAKLISQIMPLREKWSRVELANEVEKTHLSNGGLIGAQPTVMLVKKALSKMKEEGRVLNRIKNAWEWSNSIGDDQEQIIAEYQPEDIEDDEINLPKYKTLGKGSEAVYVYFNPSDAELAKLKGENSWACKVGMTSVLPVEQRIISQGAKTAFSRPPEIGLVIFTDNAYRLEKLIHHSLSYISAESVESLGCEWFITNPEKIAQWFESFEILIKKLGE